MSEEDRYSSFELHGFSPWPAEGIIAAVDRGTAIADLPGDFVVVARGTRGGRPLVRIVTATVAAIPYYYARSSRGPLVHGKTIFDVVRQARLPWAWNPRALASLVMLEHTVGEDTLHPDVLRIPAAAVVTSDGDRVTVDVQARTWPALFDGPRTKPDAAVAVLDEVFGEMAAPGAVVSLSAGFDSRLLLGLSVRAGLHPSALTMGTEESTDVKVARRIAGALLLEHRVVELRPEDYLANGPAIVELTSGGKIAAHWHTGLYARGLAPDTVHYVGSNGEFARTFYFDRGLLARGAAAAPPALLEPFLLAKLARAAKRFPPSILALGPRPRALAKHITQLVTPNVRNFGDALDCLYTSQRVRHFIGLGLALYSAHGRPRSPFLDARWLRAIARLPREERLGSNYHRRAIAAALPALLEFPIGEGAPLERRAPALYYVRKPGAVGYSPVARVLADPQVHDLLIESRGLDELLPRSERIEIARSRPGALSLLLALHFARELARPGD